MGVHDARIVYERSTVTAKIEVDIVVPSEFLPPDNHNYERWEQYLTRALAEYFPRLIEELCAEDSYLENLGIERSDVVATYRSDDVHVRGGYIITLYINGEEYPGQKIYVNMKTSLGHAIISWFRSKEIENFRMSPDIEWRDSS